MKESYGEDLASRPDLEPYADGGNAVGVASARGTGRPGYRAPISYIPRADPVMAGGRQHLHRRHGEPAKGAAKSKNPCMSGNFQRENREILWVSTRRQGPSLRIGWNGRKTSQTVLPT